MDTPTCTAGRELSAADFSKGERDLCTKFLSSPLPNINNNHGPKWKSLEEGAPDDQRSELRRKVLSGFGFGFTPGK